MSAGTAWSPDLVRELTTSSGRPPGVVTVVGPGGTGKSLLLAELAMAHERAGRTVLDAVPDDPDAVHGPVAVLVDDAHHLPDADLVRLGVLMRSPAACVVLASRPWPRPAPLRALLADVGPARRDVALGHADRARLREWSRELLGEPLVPPLVDALLIQTGGLPAFAVPLLRALARRGGVPGEPGRLVVPDEVADRVRAHLAAVAEQPRALLHALAAGTPLDEDVLGEVLGVTPDRAVDLVDAGRATGLLLATGEVVPLAARALLSGTPPDLTRRVRRRVLALLVDRGDEPLELARRLAADQVRDRYAARLLERHGEAALTDDPALATQLLREAARSGAPVASLAGRRAQAAALAGDLDEALKWADTALADETAPDRARAAGVTAAVLAQRGLLSRAAELCPLAGSERAGSAALALLATGRPDAAAAALEAARTAREVPTVLSVSEEMTAQGLVQSLRTGDDAAADIAAALSTLTRSAALLEPVGRTALLVDSPAALAALVALHCGELRVAESVLRRAVDADLGGPPFRRRHRLLLGWIAMLAGKVPEAREQVARATEGGRPLEPRDDVVRQALEVGLARRSSDLPALVRAWVCAREAVVRHPVDLFTLLPLGELVVAAARLRDVDRLGPHLAEAQALLARLGDPQLWATSLHWSGAQAAILADDPDGLRPHAAALVAAARTSPYAATLARAGRTWLEVLSNDIHPEDVVTVAEQLTAVGLGWDGSRLAGQAAARATDQRARTVLLSCARSLATSAAEESTPSTAGPHPTGADTSQSTSPAEGSATLSNREREVARLVVAGQTYREIGGQLYISAKTVEHHVSRMRQRLGAGTRSDLLARLRAELGEGAPPDSAPDPRGRTRQPGHTVSG